MRLASLFTKRNSQIKKIHHLDFSLAPVPHWWSLLGYFCCGWAFIGGLWVENLYIPGWSMYPLQRWAKGRRPRDICSVILCMYLLLWHISESFGSSKKEKKNTHKHIESLLSKILCKLFLILGVLDWIWSSNYKEEEGINWMRGFINRKWNT